MKFAENQSFADMLGVCSNRIDNGGVSGIINSVEYDSLSSLFKADSILESEIKTLDNTVSVIPEKHLSAIKEHINSIEIIKGRGYSSYSPKTRTVYLNDETKNNDIIHELGHVLADVYDIYNDKEFLNILSDGLDLSNFSEVICDVHPKRNGKSIFFLPSKKFINIYQGRIYIDCIDDWLSPIPINCMQEYFSVGFDAYFNKSQELRIKDIKLYNYIKELIKDE